MAAYLTEVLVPDASSHKAVVGDLREEYQRVAAREAVGVTNRWYWSPIARSRRHRQDRGRYYTPVEDGPGCAARTAVTRPQTCRRHGESSRQFQLIPARITTMSSSSYRRAAPIGTSTVCVSSSRSVSSSIFTAMYRAIIGTSINDQLIAHAALLAIDSLHLPAANIRFAVGDGVH